MFALAIAAAVAMYILMFCMADWRSSLDAVLHLPDILWVQAVVLSVFNYLLRFFRWHIFIGALGSNVPIYRGIIIYFSAFALTLTPGKVGETVRSVFLHSYGVGYTQSIGAFASERLMDLLAVSLLVLLGGLWFSEYENFIIGMIAIVIALFLLLRSRFLLLFAKRFEVRPVISHIAKILIGINFFISLRRLAVVLPLSLMAWAAQGIALYLIVRALGLELPIGLCVGVYCISVLLGAVSFIPGGLGVTELAIASLLVAVGLGESDAIVAALISRGLTLWLAVMVGVISLGLVSVRGR